MILESTLYISSLIYFGSMVILLSKKFTQEETDTDTEAETDSIYDDNLSEYYLDEDLEKEDELFIQVLEECNRNKINTNEEVLVSCTGDEKSMALLNIITNIFENVSVLYINHHNSDVLTDFIHDVCDFNELTFYNYTFDKNIDTDMRTFRHEKIRNICKKNDIKYVFEAHSVENLCHSIIYNTLKGSQYETDVITSNIYYPFGMCYNEDIYQFAYTYNIPYDKNNTHLLKSKTEKKHMLSSLDDIYNIIFQEEHWMKNVVKSNLMTQHIINSNNNTIEHIINNNCKVGTFGFIYYHDLEKTPYDIYRLVINGLCDDLNIEHMSESIIKNMYVKNNLYSLYIIEEIAIGFEAIHSYLIKKNIEEVKSLQINNKDSLFYIDITKEDIFDDINNYRTFKDYKYEVVLQYNMKNVNFNEDLLEGIIYFRLEEDDTFKIYYRD